MNHIMEYYMQREMSDLRPHVSMDGSNEIYADFTIFLKVKNLPKISSSCERGNEARRGLTYSKQR